MHGIPVSQVDALRAAGPISRPALPAVIEQLANPQRDVRMSALALIGSHGRTAADAVPALTKLLETADPEMTAVVLQTLGQLESAAQPAVDQLVVFLDHEDVKLRAAAFQTLVNVDMDVEQLRPFWAKALHDSDSDVRRQALRAVPRWGRRAVILLPDLIDAAGQLENVSRTLQRFEGYEITAQVVPALIERLRHDHDAVRLWAVKFLGAAGPTAKDALPQLQSMLDDPNEELRTAVATAIGLINGAKSTGPARQ